MKRGQTVWCITPWNSVVKATFWRKDQKVTSVIADQTNHVLNIVENSRVFETEEEAKKYVKRVQ